MKIILLLSTTLAVMAALLWVPLDVLALVGYAFAMLGLLVIFYLDFEHVLRPAKLLAR